MNLRLSSLKSPALAVWVGINVAIVLCTLLAAYGGWINPSKFMLAQLANMTFTAWIALSFVMILINLCISRRLSLLFLATVIVCIGPLLNSMPINTKHAPLTEEEKAHSFTLLTYNVINFQDQQPEKKGTQSRTLDYIISTDADIVCLQEAATIFTSHSLATKEQLDTLRRRYPYRIERPESAGESIWSKYKLTLLETPEQPEGSGHYIAAAVEIDGHDLTIINCHLQSIGLTSDDKKLYNEVTSKNNHPTKSELTKVKTDIISKLSNAFIARAEQAKGIKQYAATLGSDVIVAGDFNDVPNSFAYRTIMSAGFKDTYRQCGFGPEITYNANKLYFRIDHILYRGDMDAVNIRRGSIKSSDHYPVMATFVWIPPDNNK